MTKLQKVLKHLKFKYTSRKRNSCLIDREDITLWRQKYLLAIRQHRMDGKFIYYQDETWLNEGNILKVTYDCDLVINYTFDYKSKLLC